MEREQELSSLLECPVCYSIPEGEIINCERGHSVCFDCSKKLQRCALCNSRVTGSRNFTVESLIAYFRKYNISLEGKPSKDPFIDCCVYAYAGCQRTLLKSKLDEHAQKCEYRPLSCMMNGQGFCGDVKVDFSDYFEHLKLYHDVKGQSYAPSVQVAHFVKVDRLFRGMEITTTWAPYYFEYDDKVFLRHASIVNRNMRYWIQIIGTERDASKYKAAITLRSQHKMLKVAWTIPVIPIRFHHTEIEKSKEYASLTTQKLVQFCKLNEQYHDRIATHTWNFHLTLSKV